MIGWRAGAKIQDVEGISPQLASWNAKGDPSQTRLRGYLNDVIAEIGELPGVPVAIHLQVCVAKASHLHRHHDLENYLTPLIQRIEQQLPLSNIVLVTAVKVLGGVSRLTISEAVECEQSPAQFTHQCVNGDTWKSELRDAMISSGATVLPPGPVEVLQLFRCAPGARWTKWWKPSGDAMGPVLGEPNPQKRFSPNDDRIVSLTLMRVTDASISKSTFDIALWWRSLALAQQDDPQFLAPVQVKVQAVTRTKSADQRLHRVIDGAIQAANELGAKHTSVSLADIHRAFLAMWPATVSGKSRSSFGATIQYHTINVQARFPKPKDTHADASWLREPVFYRVAAGQYRMLTTRQVEKFREAVANADTRVFRPEYDALDIVGAP